MKLLIYFVVFVFSVAGNAAYNINHKTTVNELEVLKCASGLFCPSTVNCSDLHDLCPSSQVISNCLRTTDLRQQTDPTPCPTFPPEITCPYPETCPTTEITCPPCEMPTCPPCPTCDYPTTVECGTPLPQTCPTITELPCTCPTQPFCPCPTPPTCETCPTQPPCLSNDPPTFTETFYQTSLASWPKEGQLLHLGLEATTPEDDLIVYELISPPSFIILDNNRDIRFTTDVSEGAFVGPNNVLIGEVAAYVYGQQDRQSTATTVIVFPRSRKED